MIYRCKNCGGNVLYDPASKQMKCPSCDSIESQEIVPSQEPMACPNCNSPIEYRNFGSAARCGACGTWVLNDVMVSPPHKINVSIPFKITKYQAEDKLKNEFGQKLFLPADFLSAKTLEQLKGLYIPFWMYDYDTTVDYTGVGTRTRHWTSGDYRYTETSFFNIRRSMDIMYRGIPADASIAMPDETMDLVEPYNYNDLVEHDNKYLSGFEAEACNMPAAEIEDRAIAKANEDSRGWIRSDLTQYDSLTMEHYNYNNRPVGERSALLPIWNYEYRYNGKNYTFYVNGQTGKCVGTSPISKKRAFALSGILFAALSTAICGIMMFLGVF